MTVDFARERSRFRLLAERTYLAQQCLGACPAEITDDLRDYVASLARRSRGIPEWGARWAEMHVLVERFLHAPRGSVFLRDSATAAQASVAAAIDPNGERRRIVVGASDFPSSRYLWHAQVRRGFEVIEVGPPGGVLDAEIVCAAIDERVRLIALSLVSPRTGALLDHRPVIEAARRHGAIVVLDAYQAVGVVPVRVDDLRADVVVGGFHKWLGGAGTGLAFGYVDPALAATLEPVYPGWFAHGDLLAFADRFVPAGGAEKFQQGMPAMEPIYTSRAGLAWALACGIDIIRARNVAQTTRLMERARERGLPVVTPIDPARRGGMVCFDLPDAKMIVERLAEQRIDIDSRPGAGIRVGPHPCVTDEECVRTIDRIAEAAR
jgi:kynureninase